jgi:sterol desaturase/sphingolipid hydroxylase (fatty acid hydroxylase superfamily)
MNDVIKQVIHMWQSAAYLFVKASLAGIVLEFLVPGEKQSLKSRLRGISRWTLYILVGLTIVRFAQMGWTTLGIKPLIVADLRNTIKSSHWWVVVLGYTIVPAFGLLIYDFFYYWFHRLQHRQRALWRVHSVHHSLEEVNALNDYHHVLEDILKFSLIFVPLSLLIQLQTPTIIFFSTVFSWSSQIIHANSKVSYGWFRYVFVEPRYHRIHHSLESQHWNKNFAVFFPFLDIVFGTAYFPRRDEYPKTGLKGVSEPASAIRYLSMPFERKTR